MSSPHDDAAALRTSPLHDRHVALGAKFAEFGGWSMPLEYAGSGVIKEHTAVREAVGIFDVSHLGKALVHGPGAADYVNATLSNDLAKIAPGKAQYTLCCDAETGGIVDDLIAYLHGRDRVFLVPNAANTAEVLRRLRAGAPAGVEVVDHHTTHAVLAVQGPLSDEVLDGRRAAHRARVHVVRRDRARRRPGHRVPHRLHRRARLRAGRARTTRRRPCGTRWSPPASRAACCACGLGARDTLRTEMGYPLHGQDISLDVTPNQARLGWAVGWKKAAFWGKDVLVAEKEQGAARLLRGLVATGRGIPRPGMRVLLAADVPVGAVTSGTFSPTRRTGVGLALIAAQVTDGAEVSVDVRGRREVFTVTRPPFVETGVR